MAAPAASEEASSTAGAALKSEENVQLQENTDADEPNQEKDEATFDIVGVHGLYGDEKTWQMSPTSDSSASTSLNKLFSEIAPKGGRFIPYNYSSDEESTECYTVQSVYRSAHKLLEEVAKRRTSEIIKTKRPIYFACHDIGGVIVKAAIVLASSSESTYTDILYATRGIIFFGYPHRSHTIVDLEEQLFWLLSLNNGHYQRGHKMRLVKSLAEAITEINDSFIHTKMLVQARVVNIFSTHNDPSKRVFDKCTATLGIAFEYQLPSVKAHLQLTDADELDLYAKEISPDKEWLGFAEEKNASLSKSLHQASPIYPALRDDVFEYNAGLDALVKAEHNHILHIQCPSHADMIAESAKSYLSKQSDPKGRFYYFRFRSNDVRFNTISAMLWTFVAQSVYNFPSSPNTDAYFDDIFDEHPWEYQFLLNMWQVVVLKNDDATRILVLGCLDECEDSGLRLLSRIRTLFMSMDYRLRIVIVTTKETTGDKLIISALSKFPTDSITCIDYKLPSSVPAQIRLNASMLLQEAHLYASNGLREDTEALISGCSNDQALGHLLAEWLKSTQNPLESVSRILGKSRTPSSELIFESILADIPNDCHPWAQKLFAWILSSFRPLREAEFCRISDLCLGDNVNLHHGGSTIPRRFNDIVRTLRGVLVAAHGEVDFRHGSMRSWLRSLKPADDQLLSTKEWYRQTERDRQLTIVQTCLKHLQDDTDKAQVCADQLPYATQFWISHYKQVGPVEGIIETIIQSQSRLERWIDAYMTLPAPFLKPLKTSRKPLPVASHFGLETAVKSILLNNEYDNESLSQGLIEAARAAQLPVFRLIIDRYSDGLDLGDKYVQDALQAAVRSENHELCHEMISRVHLPEVRQQQPKEQYPEIPASNVDTANDDLKIELLENDTLKSETMTAEEATWQESNGLSSWLMDVLCVACELNMTNTVAKLLSFGLDNDIAFLKQESSSGDTPLSIASHYSYLDSAKLLIAAGASFAPTGGNADTIEPLHSAAIQGSSDMISLLLDHGAPIDIKDSNGWTPLQLACLWGNFAATESLLHHRPFQEYIPPDAPHPPLIVAVNHGNYKTTEALLRHGADPNVRGHDGETVLWMAVMKDRVNICRLLLAHEADPNLALKQDQITPLLSAVLRKNMNIVKLLVMNGADVNQQSSEGRTAVFVATFYKQIKIVRYLLSHNADPNIARSNGNTPVWLAAGMGSSEIVRLLVEAKADIHAYGNEYQWTAIHNVSDSAEVVRILLEYGADINKEDKDGDTPLSLAIYNNQINAIRVMLRESNIQPDWSVPLVQNAVQCAVRDGYTEVVSLALEAGANVDLVGDTNKPLTAWAIPLNDDSMIRTILEYGPDLSIKDEDGDTALHFIGKDTPLESVRRVVNAGGKLGAMNKALETPLISSIIACNMEVFSYLMTKKLVVDTLNISSFNIEGAPLHYACAQGTIEMVKVLIKHGADINYACTTVYGTPLIAATRRKGESKVPLTESIIRLLLDEGADPAISAGNSGYPIISASVACSAKVIRMLLDHKASVDVKDPFGRKPAHFACYNSLEVLNLLGVPDSDFAARDVVGRVPLHYAVLRGQLDLVEEVFARSQRVGLGIDVPDDDGWTPLLWAARVSRVFLWEEKLQPSQYDAVVSFLLSKGANPNIRGRGLYKDWSVSDVAYYHHADSIADLVAEKSPPEKKRPRPKKRGKQDVFLTCYCCRVEVIGVYFRHLDASYIRLCFKCYRSKSRIALKDNFEERGYDWDSGDEASDAPPPKPAQVASGEDAVDDAPNVGIEFDDEVVEEDDMEL
ncbi:ankyrin repeat-containing domain protein [Trichoderma barbatum]